jgi:hypothetical protein
MCRDATAADFQKQSLKNENLHRKMKAGIDAGSRFTMSESRRNQVLRSLFQNVP